MWCQHGKKQIKEAEIEARIKELEEDRERARLKNIGGVDAYYAAFWTGSPPHSEWAFLPSSKVIDARYVFFRVRGSKDVLHIDDFNAKKLRDMLLREFPLDATSAPETAKKEGKK